MITQDLGIATAYGYAKSKGYTGTEAEYAELMASYATVAQQAGESAQTASEKAQQASASATSASQSADTASASATSAQASAQTASTKASEAQQSAQTATTKAQEASQSASESSQSASTAVQAKQDAQTAKTASETAQASAEGSATTAQTAAQTATQKAAEAAESARTLTIDKTLTQEGQAADAKVVGDEISDLKEDLNLIFSTSDVEMPTQIDQITGITKKAGWNAGDSSDKIAMSPTASYDSYWFVTTEDVDVWFNAVSAAYLAIVVGGTYQSAYEVSANAFYIYCEDGSTRYRTLDSNLPTKNNKLHIPAGCAVAFTITAGATDYIYGLNTQVLKEVKESFKEQIIKTNYLQYIGSSGVDRSTERVEIYIPTVSGFIRYDFLHTESSAINSDVWRIGYAYHVDDYFAEDFAITTAGEWECAIKLDGRDDFSGGYAHGNEIMNNVLFIVDGVPVDITTLTTITAFDDLCIVEDSDLYDPADHTTTYAKHGSEHHFTKDGLSIRQSVKFIIAETVTLAYLAMLPIAKSVSNRIVPNNTFVPLSTDSAIRLYDTEKAVIYKTDGNVKAEFSIPIWEYLSEGYTFMCVDNGTTEYNKCYFVNTLLSVSVPQNKLLKTETKYNFVVSN